MLDFFQNSYLEFYGTHCKRVCPSNVDVAAVTLCEYIPSTFCKDRVEFLPSCPASDFRTKREEPNFPKIDTDAYFASCENCSILISLILDESVDERPIIEIRSEPVDEVIESQTAESGPTTESTSGATGESTSGATGESTSGETGETTRGPTTGPTSEPEWATTKRPDRLKEQRPDQQIGRKMI